MGAPSAARVFLLVSLFALVLVGFGFVGLAIYYAWLPVLSPPTAAMVTAFILLLLPAISLLAATFGRAPQGTANLAADDNTLAAFAAIARERPLLGLLLAGLFGAAGAANGEKHAGT